jgi:hypothetical protein
MAAVSNLQIGFNRGIGGSKDDDSAPSGTSSAFQAGFGKAQQKSGARKATNTLRKGAKSALKNAGASLSTQQPAVKALIPSFKKGGRVKRTGLIYAHRGETVIPAKQSRKKASGKRTTIKP